MAAALALSKDEEPPAARSGVSSKDAGTQVDVVIPVVRVSGARNTRVCIETKVLALPTLCLLLTLFLMIKQKPSNNVLIIAPKILDG